jgi:hypothetical protein
MVSFWWTALYIFIRQQLKSVLNGCFFLGTIVFGSWSHTARYLNYTIMDEAPSLTNYSENNEWSLIKYKPDRVLTKYPSWIEDDYFIEIKYKILIRRKSLFVLQNYVAPAQMLCVLTLLSFFIPFAQRKFLFF